MQIYAGISLPMNKVYTLSKIFPGICCWAPHYGRFSSETSDSRRNSTPNKTWLVKFNYSVGQYTSFPLDWTHRGPPAKPGFNKSTSSIKWFAMKSVICSSMVRWSIASLWFNTAGCPLHKTHSGTSKSFFVLPNNGKKNIFFNGKIRQPWVSLLFCVSFICLALKYHVDSIKF